MKWSARCGAVRHSMAGHGMEQLAPSSCSAVACSWPPRGSAAEHPQACAARPHALPLLP